MVIMLVDGSVSAALITSAMLKAAIPRVPMVSDILLYGQ